MSNPKVRVIAPRERSGAYVHHGDTTERSTSRPVPSLSVSTQYRYGDTAQDRLGPVTDRNQRYFAPQNIDPHTGRALASSVPERIAPSPTRIQTTTGSYQYSTGYPLDIREIEPQSATGYGATPEYPNGKAYVQAPKPYPEGTRIHRDYWDYKAQDKDYARKKKVFDDQIDTNSSTSRTVGGRMHDTRVRYTREGHQKMANLAHEANVASLSAATARLDFTSNNYGRLPRDGHPGHLKEAECLAGGDMARYSRQHGHYARGGSDREWNHKKDDYEIDDPTWDEMEDKRAREQVRAQAQYVSGGGLGGGRILPNGRREWTSVGGGERRYWSEKHRDYI